MTLTPIAHALSPGRRMWVTPVFVSHRLATPQPPEGQAPGADCAGICRERQSMFDPGSDRCSRLSQGKSRTSKRPSRAVFASKAP